MKVVLINNELELNEVLKALETKMKLKDGQEILLKAVVINVKDAYDLEFENGYNIWTDKDIIPTNAQVSKWFEVEEFVSTSIIFNEAKDCKTRSCLLDTTSITNIHVHEEFYEVIINENKHHFITLDSYNKLKERLLAE